MDSAAHLDPCQWFGAPRAKVAKGQTVAYRPVRLRKAGVIEFRVNDPQRLLPERDDPMVRLPAGTGMEYYRRVKIAGEQLEEEVLAETEVPLGESIEGYADETRLHYSGGLTDVGPELESFDAE